MDELEVPQLAPQVAEDVATPTGEADGAEPKAADPELPMAESPVDVAEPQAEVADAAAADLEPETVEDEAPAAEAAPKADDSEPKGDDYELKAILEAIVYVTDEPLSAQQIAAALGRPLDKIKRHLDELVAEYAKAEHGLSIREVAAGYKMTTKAEHHEAVRAFVKRLTPPLKLSLAALETLAVVAFKQPVTAPEIMEIRGVQGAGVLRTLLDRKLVAESGRKNVVGKPILYKTTKEFLVQFGLKDLNEMPTLKEFEELGRMELVETEAPSPQEAAQLPLRAEAPVESAPTADAVEIAPEVNSVEANLPEADQSEANQSEANPEVRAEPAEGVPGDETEAKQ